MTAPIPEIDVMKAVTTDYYDLRSPDLLSRWAPVSDWLAARLTACLDPYCKVATTPPAAHAKALDRAGRTTEGINFASQDYLGLGSHRAVVEAAVAAARDYGVHSAGASSHMGLNPRVVALEARIASFVGVADATVFSSGWAAAYSAVRTLVRAGDHIVIDAASNPALQEAASAATSNVHRYPHGSAEAAHRRLERIRATSPDAGILVVTDALFGMEGDFADLAALSRSCGQFHATLLADVSHDLGVIGPNGRGAVELQGMTGRVDVIVGSFAKTFAGNGGFVASSHSALKPALRFGAALQASTNAMAPMQAAAILTALEIVDSAEGQMLRNRLMANCLSLRDGLESVGFSLMGLPGPIVPVRLGDNETARCMTAAIHKLGAIVNLVEYPAVSRHGCRWRLQLMATHDQRDIARFVALAADAREIVMPSSKMPASLLLAPDEDEDDLLA